MTKAKLEAALEWVPTIERVVLENTLSMEAAFRVIAEAARHLADLLPDEKP